MINYISLAYTNCESIISYLEENSLFYLSRLEINDTSGRITVKKTSVVINYNLLF